MEYHILLDKLEKSGYAPQIFGEENNDCDMINIRILENEQTHFESSILYMTSTSRLPSPDIRHEFTVFCYGDRPDPALYAQSTFTIVWFGEQVTQTELFNITLEHLTELQQITSGMHLLVNALFSGNGLQYLIDTATKIFGNPIYVVDLQNKYLAMSAGIIPESKYFQEDAQTGYISASGLASIRAHKLDERVRKHAGAYYYFNELVQQGMLVDALHIQNIEVGHVMMMESEHPFYDYESDFFHRFCKLVSMELQKDSAYARNRGVMYSYFLSDLIEDPKGNIENIKERLELLGYNLKDIFYIIAIPPAGHSTSDLRLEVILDHMKQIFPAGIYVIYKDTIVFLITRPMYTQLSEYELSQLSDYLSANRLRAGISNFYQFLEDTPRFYRQAVDSVRLSVKLGDPSPISYYSDYYLYTLLEIFEKEDTEIRFLIHPGLMHLYLYDQEKNTDLLKTLQEYLLHPGQTSVITKNLHIHKNTLLYRMGKTKDITGCQFQEGDEFMHLNFSLIIMKYLHML